MNGLPGVGGILDDLIVTAKTDEEHMWNLENTLNRLPNNGHQAKEVEGCFYETFGGILRIPGRLPGNPSIAP